jgi:hypothetical protein
LSRRGTLAVAALLVLAAAWSLSGRSTPAPESLTRRESSGVSRRAPPEPTRAPTRPVRVPPRELEGLERGETPATTRAELGPDGTGHPHPITPEHRRIFAENSTLGALSGAMDQGDYVALRRMNASYRQEYPEDEHDVQQGYELIADCLEERTPQRIAAARSFWQTHRASMLRRHIRRHCLEGRADDVLIVRRAPE